MVSYNDAYEATAKTLDEARAASYEAMKKMTQDGMIKTPLTDVSVAYSGLDGTINKPAPNYYTTGVFTTSAKAGDMVGFSIYGGEKNMNIKAGTVRVKRGFLAQIFNGPIIVWESKKAYKTSEKAFAAANVKIDTTVDKLFNK